MPQFTTISPTHVPGKKEYAWGKFREGGYIAIGWLDDNLTGKSFTQVTKIIKKHKLPDEVNAISTYKKFLSLKIGDYVAVNNANHGLFGIGVITSGYRWKLNYHNAGQAGDCYSSFRKVEWRVTRYVKRFDAMDRDEVGWEPYGVMGAVLKEIPPYVQRILREGIQR